MARIKAALSAKAVEKLAKQAGRHFVGDPPGLLLCVGESAVSWIYRFTSPVTGKRRDQGLGSYYDVKLAKARTKAREQRELVLAGIDPLDARRAQRDALRASAGTRKTFAECVTGYLDAHGESWPKKSRVQWQNTLDRHAGPVIGDLDVRLVETPHILQILEPIWRDIRITAKRLRSRIENVLSWATVREYRSGENPARWRGHLSELLEKPTAQRVKHFPALPYQEIGPFMAELRKQKGTSAAALEFLILTAARTNEVIGAKWDEIDLPSRRWTVPAERMKTRKPHIVPLSTEALAVLRRMDTRRVSSHIFPGAREGKPLGGRALLDVLISMKRSDVTPHGFRSCFRDWVSETTAYPAEMAEMALAHKISNAVERAYRRGDLFEKRLHMMDNWARWCAQPQQQRPAEVVPIRAG